MPAAHDSRDAVNAYVWKRLPGAFVDWNQRAISGVWPIYNSRMGRVRIGDVTTEPQSAPGLYQYRVDFTRDLSEFGRKKS